MPDLVSLPRHVLSRGHPVNCSWFPVPAPYSIRGSPGRRMDSSSLIEPLGASFTGVTKRTNVRVLQEANMDLQLTPLLIYYTILSILIYLGTIYHHMEAR